MWQFLGLVKQLIGLLDNEHAATDICVHKDVYLSIQIDMTDQCLGALYVTILSMYLNIKNIKVYVGSPEV